ncbi:hypothetical protein SAMN04490355_10885 [Pelosinus propionicus DSM 13327]|uniref:Uncharacterized protein n=1 Tax=Pelosinus propionicus DSM 13327 TaxID=1123291 RepID=A0A1I4Q875_9FIRM|nr:hypothetical protein SAMN04490355_10885 [Pelosinus propionicus DSM 13327]
MYLNYVFELSMVLDNEKFHKLLTRACNRLEYLDDNKYVDRTLSSKGIVVTYQGKQYKKKSSNYYKPKCYARWWRVYFEQVNP